MNLTRYRWRLLVGICTLSLLVLVVAPFSGMQQLDPWTLLRAPPDDLERDIFLRLRLPRVLLAFLSGGTLGLCGMAFQAIFRNPLATPYTLGVSSGASLGAVLYLAAGLSFSLPGISGLTVCAFVGAMASILVVFFLARGRQGFSTKSMLLAGVALSYLFSSLILFMQYMSAFSDSIRIFRWLMGSLQTIGASALMQMLPFALVGCVVILLLTRELNLLALGEEMAISRGVHAARVKKILFLATSLAVSGVVSVCGPIGFVGMVVPHICRILIGPDHRFLAPASFCFGGMFLGLCDLLSRMLIAPAEIPVGVITALIGGPFFIILLLKQHGKLLFYGDD